MDSKAIWKPKWVTGKVLGQALGVGRTGAYRRAISLGIRVRIIPGMKGRRYNVADLERAVARLEREEAERAAASDQVGAWTFDKTRATAS
jgi:hypothetical protein